MGSKILEEDYEDLEDIEEDEEEEEDRGDVIIDDDEDDEDELEEEEEDGEEEADDEEDEEEDDEDDGADEEEEDSRIPRSRLNQVIQQREAEKERVKWLEDQLETLIKAQTAKETPATAPETKYDFDQAESQYIEKILEGDVESAQKIRAEINKQRDSEYHKQIETIKDSLKNSSLEETTKALDDAKFKEALADATSKYSFLNDRSKSYDEKAVRMANSLMASYVQEGLSKTEALNKAIKDVSPLFDKGTSKTKERTTEARKKAVRASKSQPPESLAKGGKRTRNLENIDIGKVPEKVFNSLSKKELAKLRGDII